MARAIVAKSYQNLEQIGDVFEVGNKRYIIVKTIGGDTKRVKAYTAAEYKRYYGEEPPVEDTRSQKELLGFKEGYITIFKGNTYENLQWFKNEPACRYTKLWGWYVVSEEEVPDPPVGIETVRLDWELVGDGETLLAEKLVREAVSALVNEPSDSEYQGEIGENIEVTLKVISVYEYFSNFGAGYLHNFKDEYGNVYIWSTSAKRLDEGKTYFVKGKIKDHSQYKNVKQTVLIRCRVKEEN